MNKTILNYSKFVAIISLLIVPIVLQYVLNWNITNYARFDISVYGIYVFLYVILQIVFSVLNNYFSKPLQSELKDPEHQKGLINIMTVGYRENADYFQKCLASLKNTVFFTPNLNKIFAIIDGQDEADMYMVEIFKEVFRDEIKKGEAIYLNISPAEDLQVIEKLIRPYKYVCLTQAHAGKRHVLYTGFKLSLLERKVRPVRAMVCTDSDTILDIQSINRLYAPLENKNITASTGQLQIFNDYNSSISFMSSLRYWFACNLERGYQSFNRYVVCVSGPLGIYKLEDINLILEEWISQTFMGQPCTYGDDRHLTNKILGLGRQIVYVSNAICFTETPESFYRFYKQQVRWCKSSYRELLWNLKCLDKHSIFMSIDLVYLFLYSTILMVVMSYLMFFGSTYQLALYFSGISVLGTIKALYPVIVERDLKYLFFFLYGGIFITCLIPARLYAGLTMKDISWGTSDRKTVINSLSYDLVVLFIWNAFLVVGTAYNVYNNWALLDLPGLLLLGSFILAYILVLSFLQLYLFLQRRKQIEKRLHHLT